MKGRTRRTLAICLMLAMVASLLIGTNLAAFAEEKEPVTFTAIVAPSANTAPTDQANAQSIRYIEEKFGVTFEVEVGSGDHDLFRQRLRLLALSGDLPDVIYTCGIRDELADEGFLLPLDDALIDAHLPSMRTFFTEKQINDSKYKGELYTFPAKINSAYNAVYIRGDWLENLGLEMPTTMEEFEAVMRAFTQDDPDGNGVDDTYGWGERNLISANFTPIFAAYGFIPQFWNEHEGEVSYGFTDPRAFACLEMLQRWYAEKLIDPEWITTSTDDWWGKIATDKLGAFCAGVSSYDGIMNRLATANSTGYVEFCPPPALEGDVGHVHSFGDTQNTTALNANIENVDRLLEIVEYFYDYDRIIELSLGVEGEDYTLIPEGGYEILLPVEEFGEKGVGWYPSMLYGNANCLGLMPIGSLNMIESLQSDREKAAIALYADVGLVDAFQGYTMSDEWIALWEELGDINTIMLEGLFAVVCGKAEVADYQNYIDEWYAAGGDRATELANAEYQAMLAAREGE